MKYLKLIWLIMSGRLRLESRNRPESLSELTAPSESEEAFLRVN